MDEQPCPAEGRPNQVVYAENLVLFRATLYSTMACIMWLSLSLTLLLFYSNSKYFVSGLLGMVVWYMINWGFYVRYLSRRDILDQEAYNQVIFHILWILIAIFQLPFMVQVMYCEVAGNFLNMPIQ